MTLRTKAIASGSATLVLGLAMAAAAQPALARWTFHNESVGESMTEPAGGTRAQTCSNRLKAIAGWGSYIEVDEKGEDPKAFKIPKQAFTPVDYDVWKAPRGFNNFAFAELVDGGIYFYEADGVTRHKATQVGRVKTGSRVALKTPTPAGGNPKVSGTFVFTSAPISIPLKGVKAGDALGLRPTSEGVGGFVNVSAIDCKLPVLKEKVDVLPGSTKNEVHPSVFAELVPVRVFGSKKLNVQKIAEVHLGEAKPSAVPENLKSSLVPKDANRDGRLDRLYYFRQGDTDIMCIDTRVKVTGRTSDKKRFEASQTITTAGCPD